jgi:hypothetical protein
MHDDLKDVERTLRGVQLLLGYGAWYSFWFAWYLFWYGIVPVAIIIVIWVLVIMLIGGGS